MLDILRAIHDTPLSTILVIGGILFLLLAVVSQISTIIIMSANRQKGAAIAGSVLLVIGIALYLVPLVPPSDVEVPFTCQICSELHIYENPGDPISAGVPSNARIYIISQQRSATAVNETVYLNESVQSIKQLRFQIIYEYHADSTENPAILEFVIKGEDGNEIWHGTQNFLPTGASKQRLEKKFSFNIDRRYEGTNVIVQIKPLKAGDFEFYIYGLNGTLVVKEKKTT